MIVKNQKELFVMLLSDARQNTERSTKPGSAGGNPRCVDGDAHLLP